MRRRSLLAALAAGTAATAGCSGVLDSEDPPTPEDPSSGTPPSTPTETGPTTPASQVDLSLPFEGVSPEAAADGPAVPDDWVAYGRSRRPCRSFPKPSRSATRSRFGSRWPTAPTRPSGSTPTTGGSTNTSTASGSASNPTPSPNRSPTSLRGRATSGSWRR
ncbi:hypothetical protein GJ629_08000 [Halapricum sp. CBA1109]|uniref:hypothetical protein n=1 Tax=Halapricum sp. CBA1109 TaxID=2668068 RepID=UPI0012FBD7CA|nr:hypothetical protein [Halapricum sp. CBA1109]MUV89843.1 hypothetical protein [Halapricum sp. CBA1109]